ncbi:MAG TPA: type 4a pilus biogenesis protein PilO [Polyangiales bacterium]|jgi:type IV pilus assembly protein PilO
MAPKLPQANFATLPVGAKIFVAFFILALLSGGYYFGVHMGMEEDIEGAKRKHSALQNDLTQAHERQKEYLKLREELAGRDAMDRQNLRILPDTAEIPAFLDDLNRLAELSGLTVGNVAPRPEVGEQFFVRVPVSLAVSGKYHQLAKFFYNISRLERAINMEDISLTAPKTEGEDIVLSVSVMATTFRRPDSARGK